MRIKKINKIGKWTGSALRGCNFRSVTRESHSEKVTFGWSPGNKETNHVAIWARALLTCNSKSKGPVAEVCLVHTTTRG